MAGEDMIELFFRYEGLLLEIVHVVMVVLLVYGISLEIENWRISKGVVREFKDWGAKDE